MRKFERLRHVRYFSTCLQNLPKQYSSADTNRLTLVHFCVQALDLLGCLPDANVCGTVGEEVHINREGIIEWIYGLQTLPTLDGDGCAGGGFKGGTYLGPLLNASDVDEEDGQREERHPYDHSHLAMTYVALCTLAALGDDLSRVNRTAILQTLQSLQKEDGSFVAVSPNCSAESASEEKEDDDCDLRFMYTAIAIWDLLTDPATNSATGREDAIINIEAATSYILRCIAYDGALGLTPGREGHGGSTFCGTASLYLMGVLDDVLNREELIGWREDLIRWCVTRQHPLPKSEAGLEHNGYSDADTAAGMQGRPNKLQDTCYSYWIGGTLHLLGESHLLDGWALREYVLMCQSPYGGFGKVVGAMPDLLHSFYSLAWLALSKEQGCCEEDGADSEEEAQVGYDSETRQQVVESLDRLSELDCALGICAKRHDSFPSPNAITRESL
ncbi:hypothetical protein ACHAXT_013043 [Thalassiosira profunda]